MSDSLPVGDGSDHVAALPHNLLDSDKNIAWILQSGKQIEPDEVVDDLPSSSNAVENTPPVDDVVDDSHVCNGRDSEVSQSSFLDDQSAHSHSIQLPTDSPAVTHSDVPSSTVSDTAEALM